MVQAAGQPCSPLASQRVTLLSCLAARSRTHQALFVLVFPTLQVNGEEYKPGDAHVALPSQSLLEIGEVRSYFGCGLLLVGGG